MRIPASFLSLSSHGVNIQLISVVGNAWELSFSHGGTIKGIKIKALNDGEFDGWDTSLYSDSVRAICHADFFKSIW